MAVSRARAQDAASCPDRESVRVALAALASDEQSRAALAEVERAELKLEDLGERYRVTVNGRSREYSDPSRDCKARAQVAAVFTALVLNPASDLGSDEPAPAPSPPPAAPPSEPPPAPPPPSPSRWRPIDVRAGFALSFAPGVGGTPHAAGLLLRASYSPGPLGVELGALLPASSAELEVGAARAELRRYPVDLSGRFALAAGPLLADFEAGVILSVLRLRDVSEGARPAVTRVEPGLRLGAGLRLLRASVSPALGLFSAFIPVRYPLALEPSGVLAHTPSVWLGGWVGLSAAFD